MTSAGLAWTGGFAEREVGIVLRSDPERSLVPIELLVGVALRRNPRRAQLLVSTVLAKHVPTDPGLVIVAAQLLGLLVAGELDGRRPGPALFARLARILQQPAAEPSAGATTPSSAQHELAALRAEVDALRSEHPEVVTIGYAETATGLGRVVAETIGAYYIHSTRLAPAGAQPFAGFEEEHSHATSHQLYPADGEWLKPGGTVVLVDDELSTGRTIVNTIRALHGTVPQARWVVASLIDLRSPDDRRRFDELSAALGTTIAVVSLGAGSIALPPDVAPRAALALTRAAGDEHGEQELGEATGPREATGLGEASALEVSVDALPSTRFGIDARPGTDVDAATKVADAVAAALPAGGSVLVLGSEEFIALPLAVADHLARVRGAAASADTTTSGGDDHGGSSSSDIDIDIDVDVRFSTTTRSPISAVDRPDYAIASAITFQSHDVTHDGFGVRFAYNLTRSGKRFDAIVFVPEPEAVRDRMLAADGVVEALRRVTDRVLVVHLTTPRTATATTTSAADAAPAASTSAAPAPTPDERPRP